MDSTMVGAGTAVAGGIGVAGFGLHTAIGTTRERSTAQAMVDALPVDQGFVVNDALASRSLGRIGYSTISEETRELAAIHNGMNPEGLAAYRTMRDAPPVRGIGLIVAGAVLAGVGAAMLQRD